MKSSRLTFFITFVALSYIFASCSIKTNKITNEAVENPVYYESTSVPPYILAQFGPIGPKEKSYPVPEGAVFVSPEGIDSNSGASIDAPTTLEKAISQVESRSVIVLRGGVYRTGNLTFNKQITIQPYLNERPIIKGSKIAAQWSKRGDFWVTKWETMFPVDPPKWYKPGGRDGAACLYNNDLVMVDGKMYVPVGDTADLDRGEFYCDYAANEIYIADDPAGKTIEISAHEFGLVRTHDENADTEGPTILGLDVMHYANSCINIEGDDPYRLIEPGEMPLAPVKTHIKNCRILFSSRTGLRLTSPDSYVAYNDISMHGNVAVVPRMSHNTIFEHNSISHSNWYELRIYPAGIKVFNQCSNFIIRNNYFSEMTCEAIWYDVGHREGLVVNNYFYDCEVGLKVEICHRTYIAANVFEKSNLWLCNSSNCLVYNNTMIDSRLDLWRNNRGAGGWNKNYTFNHVSTGPGVEGYHGHEVANNVFVGQPRRNFYLLIEDNNTYDKNFHAKVLADNLFLNEADWIVNAQFQPKGYSEPTKYASLADFREYYGEFEEGNVVLDVTKEELFNFKYEGDYSLKNVDGIPVGKELPGSVANLLGWKKEKSGLGAFSQIKQK